MKKDIAKQGTSLGIKFATTVIGCTLLGYFIGKKTVSAVGGMIAGAFLGFLGTILLAYKFLERYRKEKR